MDGKRQEILVEAVPGVHKIAVFADSNVAQPGHLKELEDAARGRGIEALVRGVAKRDQVIAAIKEAGKRVLVWTVNFPATMKRLSQWGADGIISDDPKRLVLTLGRQIARGD